VSTARQAETDLSLPDQVAQGEAYAKRNGFAVVATYVEPGASATDDKRPVFQQMISEATTKPRPYDAIIVHSFSRFFRDHLQMGLYIRQLERSGVKLIAITQDVGDSQYAELVRTLLALLDEHQSKENGKHTKRAMKENARRGNCNARPPYGYRLAGTGEPGNAGREKKRLVIEDAEAVVVRRIYDLYLNGVDGRSLGMSNIAQHLNARGMKRRGQEWRLQTVCQALTNPVYMGQGVWNRRSGKERKLNPDDELVRYSVPAIVDQPTFAAVEARRRARRPSATPARRLASPHLLSGLLTCGCCGSGMIVSTGTSKGGKVHHYYTCQRKLSRGSKACPSRRLAVSKLDHLILTALGEQILVPERIEAILGELDKALRAGSGQDRNLLAELRRRLADLQERYQRLLDAVEGGFLPLDDATRRRSQELQDQRRDVLAEIGRAEARLGPGLNLRSPKHIRAFVQAARNRLQDSDSGFARAYLRAVVSRIQVNLDTVELSGRRTALAAVVAGDLAGVQNSVPARDANAFKKSDAAKGTGCAAAGRQVIRRSARLRAVLTLCSLRDSSTLGDMRMAVRSIVLSLVAATALLGATVVPGSCAEQAAPKAEPYKPVSGQAGKDVVWVPTPQALVDRMLDMAELTKQDYLIDLGSGDGRTVITAAKRGTRALGIEYNPDMVELARRAAQAEGVAELATFTQGDIFQSDFSKASVITLFLLPQLNLKLRPILLDMKPGTRVVSNSFDMGDWTADDRIDAGGDCQSWCTAYKWVIPAKVGGDWRLGKDTLTLTQTYQMLGGTLTRAGQPLPISEAKVTGTGITFMAGGSRYTGTIEGNAMRGTIAGGGTWSATRAP
jgi:DNA invertase Pin-like site-specific DNA recombinase